MINISLKIDSQNTSWLNQKQILPRVSIILNIPISFVLPDGFSFCHCHKKKQKSLVQLILQPAPAFHSGKRTWPNRPEKPLAKHRPGPIELSNANRL